MWKSNLHQFKKKMMFIRKGTLLIILILITTIAFSQELVDQSNGDSERMKRNNIVLTLGHALVPESEDSEQKNMATIPTWGLSYEFRLSQRFLLGVKGEIEVSNYIIKNNEGDELEREYPFSFTLYADYRIIKDLYIYAGPGIELEKEENLFIATFGLFYEIEISEGWNLIPEIAYELKGGHTGAYIIGLGVSREF